MKALVIGSKGFIGSHVFEAFKNNFDTWSCDIVTDYETGKYIQISIANADFHDVFSNNNFDICVNCSGAASVPDSLNYPLKDYELNTVNVFKILDAIRRYNSNCRFINLSSAAVYGNSFQLPIKESATVQPVSPYGLHKKQAEEICNAFYNYWQLPTCNLRIFSAYGPGLTKQLFWDIYKKALAGNNIQLFGTGNETRDFIYIDDIVNAILLIIQNTSFSGECINIANGKQHAVKDLASLFLNVLQWKGNIHFTNINREGDPLNWEADLNIIKSIGYEQRISMEEGLTRYAQWLKERE